MNLHRYKIKYEELNFFTKQKNKLVPIIGDKRILTFKRKRNKNRSGQIRPTLRSQSHRLKKFLRDSFSRLASSIFIVRTYIKSKIAKNVWAIFPLAVITTPVTATPEVLPEPTKFIAQVEILPVTHFEVPKKQTKLKLIKIPPKPETVARQAVYSSNTYPICQCTRYAKQKRPDIPNHLGNADVWYWNLKSRGWSTGLIPKAGAIGQTRGGMHVVYVERVNPNGTVYISELNYDYNCGFRYRTASALEFYYIY